MKLFQELFQTYLLFFSGSGHLENSAVAIENRVLHDRKLLDYMLNYKSPNITPTKLPVTVKKILFFRIFIFCCIYAYKICVVFVKLQS